LRDQAEIPIILGVPVLIEGNTQVLSCDHLTKIYEKQRKKALDSVTFSIPLRGIFVLIGRNGSGKTTLVRILATELEPTSGSARIDGIDVVKEPDKLREEIAIVPQEARTAPWMTPVQTASSYLLWRGFGYGEARQRALKALKRLGLSASANTLNRKLSGGMRRKVLVATILASEAEIFFLDEPTTGLDPISRRELWGFLKQISKKRFIFLTTHYLDEAEGLADQIGVLDRGRLIRFGTLDQLRQSVSYNYSMKIPASPVPPVPKVQDGEVVAGKDGYRILTTEDEAFRIARELGKGGYRFSINPVSLDDIFFYVVNREEGKPVGNQEEEEDQ
jgi:ABC-2 type transport system ATP-binding protein